MLLQLPTCARLEIAEQAVLVLLTDMGLEQHLGCKSHTLLGAIGHLLEPTFAAPKLGLAVLSLAVSLEGCFGIEGSWAAFFRTLERW
jgi:hypothetical protein